jgi:hypothetical protein
MADIYTLKREARREPFTFKVDKATFTLPHVSDVDQFALAELIYRDGDTDLSFIVDWFRFMLGDQIDKFTALGLSRPDMLNIYEAYTKFTGTDEGESEASST